MPTQVEARGPSLGPSQAVPRDTLPGHSLTQDTYPHRFPNTIPGRAPPHATRTVFSVSYLKLWVGWAVASHLGPPVPGTG